MAMPSGTPIAAASRKPPNTRQMVTPMSRAKPCTVSSCHPADTIVSGSARNVRLTKPPSVATAHAATKTTKNPTPRASAAAAETGTSGLTAAGSLDEACVDDRVDVRHGLDDAQLQQELGGVLAEGLQVAGEELGVGRAVLPAEVRL